MSRRNRRSLPLFLADGILADVNLIVLDYGAGNLLSVANCLRHLGARPTISESPETITAADGVILPGVGAAGITMSQLQARGLVDPLLEYIASGRPFLGVCLGMQILFEASDEANWQSCLAVLSGRVLRFQHGLKVPHMGWNQVTWQGERHPMFRGIANGSSFYFAHSYYCQPVNRSEVVAFTEHGYAFCSAVGRGNLIATQFHPEKSGNVGLRFYANFLELASSSSVR